MSPPAFLTCSLVQDTVVWGVVKVDKVSSGGTAIALAGRCEVGTILGGRHLHGSVVAPPQVIPRAAEVRECPPAGAQRAGAANAVTLTLQLQKPPHSLVGGEAGKGGQRSGHFVLVPGTKRRSALRSGGPGPGELVGPLVFLTPIRSHSFFPIQFKNFF